MTRIVLVRHGETAWNREGRLQGWAPVPLNETGREQADALGAHLAAEYDIDRVLSSDLLRARETTERVREHLGDPPTDHEAAWRERDLGVYQGLTYADAEARFPEFGLGEAAYEAAMAVPESGESLRDVADRVTRRLDRLVDADGGDTVLVVAHGGPIHVLLGYLKGMALGAALADHHQDNCAVNELAFGGDDEGGRVRRENATDWR